MRIFVVKKRSHYHKLLFTETVLSEMSNEMVDIKKSRKQNVSSPVSPCRLVHRTRPNVKPWSINRKHWCYIHVVGVRTSSSGLH